MCFRFKTGAIDFYLSRYVMNIILTVFSCECIFIVSQIDGLCAVEVCIFWCLGHADMYNLIGGRALRRNLRPRGDIFV